MCAWGNAPVAKSGRCPGTRALWGNSPTVAVSLQICNLHRMIVDTRHVKDRRLLRFETFADAIRDVELLADAERAGTLRAAGNWSLGQAVGHVATWARFPLDG